MDAEPLGAPLPGDAGPTEVASIVVLEGTVDMAQTERYSIPALNDAAERITTFVVLARRYKDAKLAFTSGSGLVAPGRFSEADVATRFSTNSACSA